jgi:hypothetical protein
VDAYANCFVKRNQGSKLVEPQNNANIANIAPPALRMSDIDTRGTNDKDGGPCT